MVKCLVFSDSHGRCRAMAEAIRRNPDADAVIYLGDGLSDIEGLMPLGKSVFAVRGNNDFTSFFDGRPVGKTEVVTLEGKRIVLTHGDLYGVRYGWDGLSALATSRGADVVLFGHTHIPSEHYEGGVGFFNPGSIGEPPDGTPSFGILTLTPKDVLFSFGTVL